MVVRRRPALMAAVTLLASAAAAGYLGWYARTGSGLSLLLGVSLLALAAAYALAWRDARTPLLVADATGLRIRVGGHWRGLPWSRVDLVEVEPRGRVGDGHVVVTPHDAGEVLDGAGRRARLATAVNRWVYDAPLVVPFGLATQVSVPDIAATLRELADGRTVVEESTELQEPLPTVELTVPSHSPGETAQPPEADSPVASEPPPVRRPALVPRPVLPFARVASAVSALRSQARREEVTMPVRPPATVGTLALSDPYADAPTEPLPEISELRRSAADHDDFEALSDEPALRSPREVSYAGSTWSTGAADSGNVALIIDATTDLSARAMQRVRRPANPAAPGTTGGDAGSERETEQEPSRVGGEVAQARRRLRLGVDELAERTRIRPYVIESIEADDFAPCGGDFYARGHLRMLAKVLGIDPEPLVAAYDESFASSPVDARAVFDLELSPSAPGLVRGGTSGASWRGLIAAVLLLMLLWGVAQYVSARDEPSTDLGVHNAAGLGSPGPGNRPLPVAAPQASATVQAVGGSSRIVVSDTDGNLLFSGVLRDGASRRVSGAAPLRVEASNAAAFRLRVDGKRVGRIGEPGQTVRRLIPAS